jgi:hypothetical protein
LQHLRFLDPPWLLIVGGVGPTPNAIIPIFATQIPGIPGVFVAEFLKFRNASTTQTAIAAVRPDRLRL